MGGGGWSSKVRSSLFKNVIYGIGISINILRKERILRCEGGKAKMGGGWGFLCFFLVNVLVDVNVQTFPSYLLTYVLVSINRTSYSYPHSLVEERNRFACLDFMKHTHTKEKKRKKRGKARKERRERKGEKNRMWMESVGTSTYLPYLPTRVLSIIPT